MDKSNAQTCLNKLCDELLGPDYYIVDPVGRNQANEIITNTIIEIYKRSRNRNRLKEWLRKKSILGV